MESKLLTPKETMNLLIKTGKKKCSYTIIQLILLGIFAGMFIAIGAYASTLISTFIESPGLARLAGAAVFPVGLMLILMSGAELFTGNNLLITSLLDGEISLADMLKNWSLVYIGNFIGSVIVVVFIYLSGLLKLNGGSLGAKTINLALFKVGLTFSEAFIRAILCNVMVVLAVWMAAAARDAAGKLLACWFPIMLFVLAGFEHSIANMYFIPIGILSKTNNLFIKLSGTSITQLNSLTWVSFITNNLIPVTLGNIVGGAVIVGGVFWYIHRFREKDSNKFIKHTAISKNSGKLP